MLSEGHSATVTGTTLRPVVEAPNMWIEPKSQNIKGVPGLRTKAYAAGEENVEVTLGHA